MRRLPHVTAIATASTREDKLFCYRRQATTQLYVYVLLLRLANGDATPSNLTTEDNISFLINEGEVVIVLTIHLIQSNLELIGTGEK